MNTQEQTTQTHHMVDDQMTPQQALDQFISKFPYSRYNRLEDRVTYSIMHSQLSDKVKKEAEDLVKENHYPLQVQLHKNVCGAVLIITIDL